MKQIVAVALVVVAIVFGSVGASQARPNGGHGSAGGQVGARIEAHPGFQGQSGFQGRQQFQGHRAFHRGGRVGVFFGAAPVFVGPAYAYSYGEAYDPGYVYSAPMYSAPAPSYWYYCPSYSAYYPDVPSCPEPWVPVPAQ